MVDKKTWRLLDANLNRAREGLRVVEDTARYIWSNPALYARLRKIRHQLHTLTAKKYKAMVEARNSVEDHGRKIKEGKRSSQGAVVSANLRRAQEAARVLEEYSKVFNANGGGSFKKIRYQLYDEEKRILKKYG